MTVTEHPRPLASASLLASARRLTAKNGRRVTATSNSQAWQDDAWDLYGLVGEQRFLAATLAGRVSQARLYVGELPDDPAEEPEPVDDPKLNGILEAIGDSAAARGQLVYRLAINLFVPGDCWLAGIPRALFPPDLLPPLSLMPEPAPEENPDGQPEGVVVDPNSIDIDQLEWRALSLNELTRDTGERVTVRLGEGDDDKIVCSPDDLILIRIWRSHPRKAWEADSPTRSSLPVLRELVGLTMGVSAQIDSRLAGAGLLIVPQSAKRALMIAQGLPEDSEEDPFTDALIEAMMTPINDRSSASAVVPLVITVPDEVVDKFVHMTFATPLDPENGSRVDQAIRRLALGEDCPPELLLGTSGMNHWGAWLVQEDTVTTHLEPPLAIICDAITTQYLWPVLIDQGMTEEEAHKYVIWYDVSDLVVRPNRSQDAFALHEAGALSDEALRDATGFDQSDAPGYKEDEEKLPPAVQMAFDLVKANPALANTPGLPQLVAQIQAVLDGDIPEVKEPQPVPPQLGGPPVEEPPADDTEPAPANIPQTDGQPAVVPAPAAPPAQAASGIGVFIPTRLEDQTPDSAEAWPTYPTGPHGPIDYPPANGSRF